MQCAQKITENHTRACEVRSRLKFKERCACGRAKNGRTLTPCTFLSFDFLSLGMSSIHLYQDLQTKHDEISKILRNVYYYYCKRLLKFERCDLTLIKVMPTVPIIMNNPVDLMFFIKNYPQI